MNNIYKIIFIILLNLSALSLFAQDGIDDGDNTVPPIVGPGDSEQIPCPEIPGGGISDGDSNFCNETVGPGNVPINDYIPLLALAAITIGGITFYRNQRQII
jgi:hypothetical protein